MANPEAILNQPENTNGDNPWGKSFQEGVPPFAGDSPEASDEKVEDSEEDYYTNEDGVELRNLNKINTSNDEGKLEWLMSLYDNSEAVANDTIENDTDDEKIQHAQENLRHVALAKQIFQDEIDLSRGSLESELIRIEQKTYRYWNEMSPNATEQSKTWALERYEEAQNILKLYKHELSASATSSEQAPTEKVGLSDIIESLDTEIIKREKAIPVLEQRGQEIRELANDALNAKAKLTEKQQDRAILDELRQNLAAQGQLGEDGSVPEASVEQYLTDYIAKQEKALNEAQARRNAYEKKTPEYRDIQQREVAPIYRQYEAAKRVAKTYFGIEP